MSGFRKLIPSPHSLFVFEAAARTLNFHLASKELNVTQPSVSHSIKALERHCGTILFIRENRGVQLTEPGRILYDAIRISFQRMEDSLRAVSQGAMHYLTFAVSTSMANFWLVPKLHQLQHDHPNLKIKVITTDRDIEPNPEMELTFWVREKGFRRPNSWYLGDEKVFPVCSPAFFASMPKIKTVEQLSKQRLLHSFDAFRKRTNWNEWLEAVDSRPYNVVPNLLFNDYQLITQAAIDGEGIALGWNLTAQMLLKRGILVKPFDKEVAPGGAFYLVADDQAAKTESVKTIVSWLLEQTSELRDSNGHG